MVAYWDGESLCVAIPSTLDTSLHLLVIQYLGGWSTHWSSYFLFHLAFAVLVLILSRAGFDRPFPLSALFVEFCAGTS